MMNSMKLTSKQLAAMLDHTCLKPYADEAMLKQLCDEAKSIQAAMVAINSSAVSFCKEQLKGTAIHVGAAISFPLGQTDLVVKLKETEVAIQQGADEIDYVINLTEVKEKRWNHVKQEMQAITELCHQHNVLCKVIFENCYLEKEEIIQLCSIAKEVKPDFIKTSTGFGTSGAAVEDVNLMKSLVQDEVKVKAAGGIRSWACCKAMIEAGAQRIGTSSSLQILKEFLDENAA